MTAMTMSQQAWYAAAAGYLGMWMAMMVPMMLPSLVPMLARYRRSVSGTGGFHLHGLTALVGAGYFAIWAAVGMAAFAVSAGVMAFEMEWSSAERWLPAAVGALLLAAGGLQLTPWKARQLTICRDGPACGRPPGPNALEAWRHGLRLGMRCSLCCAGLMVALLAIGMMNLLAIAMVTLTISAERLTPIPLRVARLAGMAIVVAGVVAIARI